MLNATYDYKYTISITSPSSYTLNGTGTSKIQKYNNDSRIDMTTSVADRNVVSAIIYNSTANMGYVCTSTNGGIAFSCRTSAKVDIWGNAGGMGFLASQGGSENVTGYFSNIAVSDSSYNGIPCTLVTGDVYGKSNATSGNPGVVLKGRMGSCISSQYGTWITQFMTGTIQTSMSGYAVNATLNYSMNEVSIGTTTSAAITELPGPVVS
jgi:hypothetical protein